MIVPLEERECVQQGRPCHDHCPHMVQEDKMICSLCNEPILSREDRADIMNMDYHRECSLRNVLGGIGHLLDHAHFCHGELGPDAGLDYRTSALMVDIWVARISSKRSVEN